MKIKTPADTFYWRIVPVGFGTAFLSGAFLAALILSLTVKGWDDGGSFVQIVMPILTLGMLALLCFGVVGWLPLVVVWNWAIFKLRLRFGLLRAAVGLSTALAFGVTAAAALLLVKWDDASLRQFFIFGLWPIGTALIAAGLSYVAFRSERTAAL